MKHTQWD